MRYQYHQLQRENADLKQENYELKEKLRMAEYGVDAPEGTEPNGYVHFDGDGHGVGYRTSTSDRPVKR